MLYIAEPFLSGSAHYGSRVVNQGDYLYMTIGDRGDKNFENHVSQDTTNVLGTTLRLLRDGTIVPVHYWECGSGGFPPAGMTFYDADGFVDWQGDLFVGGLAGQYLAHFRVTGDGIEELNPLLVDEGWRFRDVTVGYHDGAIYAAVEGRSVSIIRIIPKPVK